MGLSVIFIIFIGLLSVTIIFLSIAIHKIRSRAKNAVSNQQFMAEILDTFPFPVVIKDVSNDLRYIYWNKETEIQTGIPKKEAIGRTDYELYPEKRASFYIETDKKVLSNKAVYGSEYEHVLPDGNIRNYMFLKSYIERDERSKWVLSILWDTTVLKKYEKEAIDAKNQIESAVRKQNLALKSIDFGLVYVDMNYVVQWQATENIKDIGHGSYYTAGRLCYETCMKRNEPCVICPFKEAVKAKGAIKMLDMIGGINVEITATPIYDNENKEIIGGLLRIEDITEKMKFQKLLEEAKEKAEESNRLKSAFLANMSHEIRTPLNSIIGFSDLISRSNDPEEKKEYMKIVSTNNEILLKLIGDILDMSKIEAGAIDLYYEEINVNEMLENIYQQMLLKNTSMDVKIEFTDKVRECVIKTDRSRLSQVLINFLTNALKFTRKGKIAFGYHIEKDTKQICFFVRDTGIGIPSDKLNDIFERFVKLDNYVNGTGLGLPISRLIIKKMGGTLGVNSKEGEGSEFWCKIPILTEQVLN